VAVDLLGCRLCRLHEDAVTSGRIVETEAYLSEDDLASHAAWSRRGRETMEREPGTVYMYRAYGIHMMFNIVARTAAPHGAVLIRAIEPETGIETMQGRRGTDDRRALTSGPGKLAQALALRFDDHLTDLVCDSAIWIEAGEAPHLILASKRIGITKSADLILRFFDGKSPYVSASRQGIVAPVAGMPAAEGFDCESRQR
jgi:DNA-3-methyladenine glycosylase